MAKKKFKVVDKRDEVEWEGEDVRVESETKIQDDKGVGQEIILRTFDFVANPEVFAHYKPTAQELFESHRKGMESTLWADGLTPYHAIEPKVIFSKDKSHYRFFISCVPGLGNTLIDKPRTLDQLLNATG